jgi:hypothetical protein
VAGTALWLAVLIVMMVVPPVLWFSEMTRPIISAAIHNGKD